MTEKTYPGFSTSTGKAILELLKTYFPELHQTIIQDPSGPVAFLVAVEQYLLEGSIEYARALLKEQFLGTSLSTDAVILKAIESGYKPSFAKPASGQATLIVPYKSLSDNKVLINAAYYSIDFKTNSLVGKQIVTNEDIPFLLDSNYEIFISPLSKLVKRNDPNTGKSLLLSYEVGTYSIAGNNYESLFIPINVRQVTLEEIDTTLSIDTNGIGTIDLSIDLDQIANIKVFIDGEEAEFVPLIPLFRDDKYCFTMVRFENGARLVLSNPIFGKPVQDGAQIKIVLEKTLASKGNIRQNSLRFLSEPKDKFTGKPLNPYTIKHKAFDNGREARVLKADIYRFVQQSKRTITQTDYFNLLLSKYGTPSLSVPRHGLGQNEVATFIALPKNRLDDLTLDYIRTSTKAIVLKRRDLENLSISRGQFHILPLLTFTEDFTIHPSGYFCRPLRQDDSIRDKQTKWRTLFLYQIDDSASFFNHAILNPAVISNYTLNQTLSNGFFKGFSTTAQLLNFSAEITSNEVKLTGVLQLSINGGNICSILHLSQNDSPKANIKLELIDTTGQLSLAPLTTDTDSAELKVISCTESEAYINFQFSLPLTSAIYQYIPSTLKLTTYIRQNTSENFTKIGEFTIANLQILSHLTSAPKIAKISAVKKILPQLQFEDDDYLVIYDVPLIHYTDYNDYSEQVRDSIIQISSYLKSISPLTVSNTVLLAQTFGHAFSLRPYNFSEGIDIAKEGELIKLPITIKADLLVYKDKDIQLVVDEIKSKLYNLINKVQNPLISNISKHAIYGAISEVSNVISFELKEPQKDIVTYPVDYFESLQYRIFVPFVKYISEESFVFNITPV